MEQSLLFGNGFNQLSSGVKSWADILKDISSNGEVISGVSNTLQYENLFVSNNVIPASQPSGILSKSLEYRVKRRIVDLVANFHRNDFFDLLVDCDVQHYMTTNYDMAIDGAMPEAGFKPSIALKDRYESLYNIHRKRGYLRFDDLKTKYIWPIHGEMDYPMSIMIGYDHYCGSLAKINQVVKGGYELKTDSTIKLGSIINRLEASDRVRTWVDLFFMTDVHIIGLGLCETEIDLWWILNKRKRMMMSKPDKIRNKIYYYGVVEDKYKRLLESFDVIVHDYTKPKTGRTWKPLYYNMLNQMNANIEAGKVV